MGEALGNLRRDGYCGDVREESIGREVTLMGWVNRRRDLGGVVFIDLRDRAGNIQAVFNPEFSAAAHEKAAALRNEYVIAVKGMVARRPQGTENPELKTGNLEIQVKELFILSESNPVPFPIDDEGAEAAENLRLKYRYLDLRRPKMQKNIILRDRAARAVRDYLHSIGFLEIETPFLTKSTPEGARDYLVPSRVNPGQFYALPQSPQLFKQILMMSGFDRYFQIVKCFRDEDLRADRQPEFTQIDMEMAFISEEDIMRVVEGLMAVLFKELLDIEVSPPFPRLTYQGCMDRFGLDRPDLRFGLELKDLTDLVKDTAFRQFREVVDQGGVVKALNGPGLGKMTRKELDELIDLAGVYGARGLAWVKVQKDGWQSPLAKYFP
ncbi:MAG TPA: aspartate--tRNA ligase [Thermodesulfobacteriota bacterium]|nr:aspartate--tRNA ligase [Thermodesulfobacteriota bacterium]